ncbi:MAG: hypothetical protein ACLUI3_04840 [Christensenellales bacterium]
MFPRRSARICKAGAGRGESAAAMFAAKEAVAKALGTGFAQGIMRADRGHARGQRAAGARLTGAARRLEQMGGGQFCWRCRTKGYRDCVRADTMNHKTGAALRQDAKEEP